MLPSFFFFNDTATTEIYTLSLHDALPIYPLIRSRPLQSGLRRNHQLFRIRVERLRDNLFARSEEHTSELQSHLNLVCRLLLEKKKNKITQANNDEEVQRESEYISARQDAH